MGTLYSVCVQTGSLGRAETLLLLPLRPCSGLSIPTHCFSSGHKDAWPDAASLPTPCSTWFPSTPRLQGALSNIKVTAECRGEPQFSTPLSALTKFAPCQRGPFLKGGVAKNVFRKGLFAFACSQNGSRAKPILAAFLSCICHQITHKTKQQVLKIFRKWVHFLPMLFHRNLPTKLRKNRVVHYTQEETKNVIKTRGQS